MPQRRVRRAARATARACAPVVAGLFACAAVAPAGAQLPTRPDPAELAIVVRPAAGPARIVPVYTVPASGGTARYVDAADLATGLRGGMVARGEGGRVAIAGVTLDVVEGVAFARVSAAGATREVPSAAPARVVGGRVFLPLQLVIDALPASADGALRFDPVTRTLAVVTPPAAEAPQRTTVLPSIIGRRHAVETPASDVPASDVPAADVPAADVPASPSGPPAAATRRRTVVVDAGHGGVDPGMRGAAPGGPAVLEKDVTLGVARTLRTALAARGLDVVLTRDRDTLVALADRGRIANARHGDLFVSVHVNAANPAWRDPSAVRGFETYFLSDARTEEARAVAARENESAQYEAAAASAAADPLRFIVSDLAQNEYLRGSQRLAQAVQRRLGRVHPAPGRGVFQAGFKVLVTASMPAVLVEVGYGSNAADAAYITGAAGQRAIAEAIADAAVEYLERYGGARSTAERRP